MSKYFVLQMELNDSDPLNWRKFQAIEDLTLEQVHLVIQGMFGWHNYHSYRFSTGIPFSNYERMFFTESEIEEDFLEEAESIERTPLNEVLFKPGDRLEYFYDYGAGWHFTITLLNKITEPENSLPAICLDGEMNAPPEDGPRPATYENLVEVLENPHYFDLTEINSQINSWLFAPENLTPLHLLSAQDRREVNLLTRFPLYQNMATRDNVPEEVVQTIFKKLEILFKQEQQQDQGLSDRKLEIKNYSAINKLLKLVNPKVELTREGYLPPELALQMIDELDARRTVVLPLTEEPDVRGLEDWRKILTKIGFFRKSKGELIVTKKGLAAIDDPQKIHSHLVSRMLPRAADINKLDFKFESTLITLLFVATSDNEIHLEDIADALTKLGWSFAQKPLKPYHVVSNTWQVLPIWMTSPIEERIWYWRAINTAAVNLAKETLLQMEPAKQRYRPSPQM